MMAKATSEPSGLRVCNIRRAGVMSSPTIRKRLIGVIGLRCHPDKMNMECSKRQKAQGIIIRTRFQEIRTTNNAREPNSHERNLLEFSTADDIFYPSVASFACIVQFQLVEPRPCVPKIRLGVLLAIRKAQRLNCLAVSRLTVSRNRTRRATPIQNDSRRIWRAS